MSEKKKSPYPGIPEVAHRVRAKKDFDSFIFYNYKRWKAGEVFPIKCAWHFSPRTMELVDKRGLPIGDVVAKDNKPTFGKDGKLIFEPLDRQLTEDDEPAMRRNQQGSFPPEPLVTDEPRSRKEAEETGDVEENVNSEEDII